MYLIAITGRMRTSIRKIRLYSDRWKEEIFRPVWDARPGSFASCMAARPESEPVKYDGSTGFRCRAAALYTGVHSLSPLGDGSLWSPNCGGQETAEQKTPPCLFTVSPFVTDVPLLGPRAEISFSHRRCEHRRCDSSRYRRCWEIPIASLAIFGGLTISAWKLSLRRLSYCY